MWETDWSLPLIIIAICSYFAVKAWVNARRDEREALYKSEAIKRIAEMQGNIPDATLEVLREAMKPREVPPGSILNYDYNREREAYYRNETIKKIAEMQGGAVAALDYLRSEDTKKARRRGNGMKLGGMITTAAGIGVTIFLWATDPHEAVWVAGLVPVLVGIALLAYAFITSPVD